jgi:hypothetical protein
MHYKTQRIIIFVLLGIIALVALKIVLKSALIVLAASGILIIAFYVLFIHNGGSIESDNKTIKKIKKDINDVF